MTNLLPAALIIAAMIATPAMARTSHVTSRHHAQDVDARASPTASYIHDRVGILPPGVSAFVRLRTGTIAMSAITRVFAETAAQRTDRFGDMRRSYGEPFVHSLSSEMPKEIHCDWTQRRSSSRSPLMYNVSGTTLVGS